MNHIRSVTIQIYIALLGDCTVYAVSSSVAAIVWLLLLALAHIQSLLPSAAAETAQLD